jgi:hypothetical protein
MRSLPTTPQGRPCGRPPQAAALGRNGTTRTDRGAGRTLAKEPAQKYPTLY